MSAHTGTRPALWLLLWSLTLMRVVLLPFFFLLAARVQEIARSGFDPDPQRVLLAALLLAMGLSDVADGWVARRYDLATQAGALVDALADKLVQVTVAAYFTFLAGPAFPSLPFWFLALLVGRDALLGVGWLSLRLRGFPVRVVHRMHGKLSSLAVFLVFFSIVGGVPARGLPAVFVPVSLLILTSTVAYAGEGLAQLPELRDRGRTRR